MEHTVINPIPPEPLGQEDRAAPLRTRPSGKRIALFSLVFAGEILSGLMILATIVFGIPLFFSQHDDSAAEMARILIALASIVGWLVAFVWITASVTAASLATVGARALGNKKLIVVGRVTYIIGICSYIIVLWPLIKLVANR